MNKYRLCIKRKEIWSKFISLLYGSFAHSLWGHNVAIAFFTFRTYTNSRTVSFFVAFVCHSKLAHGFVCRLQFTRSLSLSFSRTLSLSASILLHFIHNIFYIDIHQLSSHHLSVHQSIYPSIHPSRSLCGHVLCKMQRFANNIRIYTVYD